MPLLRSLVNRNTRRTEAAERRPPPVRRSVAAPSHVNCRSSVTPEPTPPPISETLPLEFLKNHVDAADRVGEVSRLGGSTLVHVSSLIGMCPRQYVLAHRDRTPLFNQITGGHRLMFATGRAVESHIRDAFIAGGENQPSRQLLGHMSCPCTKTKVPALNSDGVLCDRCGMEVSVYHELPLIDEEAGIVGNPDLPIVRPDGRIMVYEIKSMTKDQFDDLRAPVGNHIFQVTAYRRLLQRNGYDVTPYVGVIYANKQFKWGSPYKDFVFNVEGAHEAILDNAWEMAATVKHHIENGTLPERVVCDSLSSPKAKKCPVAGQCFMRG